MCVLLAATVTFAAMVNAQQPTAAVAPKTQYGWLSDPNFAQTLNIVASRPFTSSVNLRYNRISSFSKVYNWGVNTSDRQIISPQFYPLSHVIVSAPTNAYSARLSSRIRSGRWSWSQWAPKPDMPGVTPGGVGTQPFVDRQLLYSLPSGRSEDTDNGED